MDVLIGNTVFSGGEDAEITWPAGDKTKAKYIETYGYTHVFMPYDGRGEIKLSNSFMRRKGIRVAKLEKQNEENK